MTTTKKLIDLSNFHGTENYYRVSPIHPPGFVITDGVKYLADEAGAYWLIDLIASYQPSIKDQPFQVWTLKVRDSKGEVIATNGNGEPLYAWLSKAGIRQEIPFTDFPMDEVTIWVETSGDMRVAYLPSEH